MKIQANIKKSLIVLIALMLIALPLCGAMSALAGQPVIIFHAGSLSMPLKQIVTQFEAANPDIKVQLKGGGSTKMARMISDENQPADIMASADYKVIDKTLIPKNAKWNIRFAANQLVLCYTGKSKYANEIDEKSWTEILARKDVSWGHSDPNLDPCGYRSLMVIQLAEKFYSLDGLYDRLIANRPQENVRPKADELVAMLKSGQLDYGWEYLSVAVQHGLKYVKLNDHINLGNYEYDGFYKNAVVKVTGSKPGTWIERVGMSVTYGITMITGSPNPEGAAKFMVYMLSPEGGLKVLGDMGQPPFIPARVSSQEVKDSLPAELAQLVEVKK